MKQEHDKTAQPETYALDELTRGEQEIDQATQIGETILRSLPVLQTAREKHNQQETITTKERMQFEALHTALVLYTQVFPNPLHYSTHQWPLAYETERLQWALQHNWFGRTDVYPFIDELESTLLNEYNLPQAANYPPDLDALKMLSGMRETYGGIRFMPGFRKLNWLPSETDEVHDIMYAPATTTNRIHLRKPTGREFYLSSTHGLYALERVIERSDIPIAIRTISTYQSTAEAQKPYVLFDKDRTLESGIDPFDYREEYEAFEQQKGRLLTGLATRTIPSGLWTRAYAGEAQHFAAKTMERTGVSLYPTYDYGNWPGFVYKTSSASRGGTTIESPAQEDMQRQIAGLSKLVKHALQTYSQQTFGITDISQLANIVHNFLSYRLNHQKPIFTDSHKMYNPLIDTVLEAKVPLFAALLDPKLEDETRIGLIQGGVLVNDAAESLPSALTFGYNYIYVHNAWQIENALRIIIQR